MSGSPTWLYLEPLLSFLSPSFFLYIFITSRHVIYFFWVKKKTFFPTTVYVCAKRERGESFSIFHQGNRSDQIRPGQTKQARPHTWLHDDSDEHDEMRGTLFLYAQQQCNHHTCAFTIPDQTIIIFLNGAFSHRLKKILRALKKFYV